MKVEVYFNLHKQLFSVRALTGENAGRVIGHRHFVAIENARFKVQQAGRNKVIREQKKNVHAFIRGWLDTKLRNPNEIHNAPYNFGRVSYNPYRAGCFQQMINGQVREISFAGLVYCYLDENGKPQIVFNKDEGAEGPAFIYGGMNEKVTA